MIIEVRESTKANKYKLMSSLLSIEFIPKQHKIKMIRIVFHSMELSMKDVNRRNYIFIVSTIYTVPSHQASDNK